MFTIHSRCAAIVALVTLVGCGSSSSGGGSVAMADFAAQSATVSCHRVYTCCDATELAGGSDPTGSTTEAACVTAMTTQQTTALMAFQAGITAGTIVYHGDRAKKCLDNTAALSCSDWGIQFNPKAVPDCAHVFDGTAAMAATCTYDEECASGFCGGGMCAARGALGDACTAPTGCADGLY